ncbi:MAG TPA: MFS transporter [archaeon]|nr:MFS transporter [archaeon]
MVLNELFADARTRDKVLVLSVLWTVFVFALSSVNPMLSPYIKSKGFDNTFLSILFAVSPLVVIFSSHFIGAVSDEIGRKRVMAAGVLAQALAFALYVRLPTWEGIVAARVLEALALAALTIGAVSKVEDYAQKGKRGATAGIAFSMESVGAMLGPLFGAFLADHFFVSAPLYSSTIILLLLFVFGVGQVNWKKKHPVSLASLKSDFATPVRRFLSVKELRGMAWLGFTMHACWPALFLFVPLFVLEELHGSFTDAGVFFFILGSLAVLQALTGRLSDKFGDKNLVLVGTFFGGAAMIVMAFSNSLSLLFLAAFTRSVSHALWNVSAWSLMSDIGEGLKKEGTIVGSYMSLAKTGAFLSFLVSGAIVTAFGYHALFALNGVLVLAATAAARLHYFK